MEHAGDSTRARILCAARTAFLEKGFREASMRQIAKLADTSLANLYNYYASKEDLFAAVTSSARSMLLNRATSLRFTDRDSLFAGLAECRAFRLLLDSRQDGGPESLHDELVRELADQARDRHGDLAVPASFFRLYAEMAVALIVELLRPGLSADEMDSLVDAFVRFEQSGWKGLAGQ
ncbi:MAG: TetR/AcrR family transcriptional regulator [Bacteroidales bacterium]|nr:TetR/AcrR family transcriptional regulator [Bacteroidales bacterium]MBR4352918.1 TetR/AcrR family transcriptional regulator [Bacteroidales bacterium]